jgi:hypothetical protein
MNKVEKIATLLALHQQVRLVQHRATTHRQMFTQDGISKDGSDAPRQPQVLLDLTSLGPRGMGLPGC